MYKAAVIGDYDSSFGFGALGLSIFPVEDYEEAEKILKRIIEVDYKVIYITEDIYSNISKTVSEYSEEMTPAIIPIPGVKGNTGIGVQNVKKFVEQAVGSDILFGDD